MKTLRFMLALTGASLLLAGSAFAADKEQSKCQDQPKDQAACTCGKDKDGKTCGTDKDCCCTGAKATKDEAKKEEPKQEEAKKP